MTEAVFTSGSTMRHVVVMSSTSALGLMAIFIVDLIDMLFLGMLGEAELAAAIGYAGTILFFTTSINIGIAIATGALTAKAIGSGNVHRARRLAMSCISFAFLFGTLFSAAIWFAIPSLLESLGARGHTLALATVYLEILVPSMSILAIGMCASSLLRARGDARGAMYATLIGAAVNLLLDPIFIFVFDWGIAGAAWASVVARVAICLVALWGSLLTHSLIGKLSLSAFREDISKVLKIAIPSMLTNTATPIGNAYVIVSVASFGDSAVAGMSIVGRVIPVAFGLIFALSGAVGPIIGQNFGAGNFDRVRQTLIDSLCFSGMVVAITSALLFVLQNLIIDTFNASAEAADMIRVFCTWVAASFFFTGLVFISNAAFNNLGYPLYSTLSNFARAVFATIPCVYLGALWGGHTGVLLGQAAASVIVGAATIWICFHLIARMAANQDTNRQIDMNAEIDGDNLLPIVAKENSFQWRFPAWPTSNSRD